MADLHLDDNSPLGVEGKRLSFRLLELRHLLETGRRTAGEVRKELWRMLNEVPPPPFERFGIKPSNS